MDDGLQRAHDRLLEENGDMRREIEVLTRDVDFLLAQNRRLTAENRDLLEVIDDWRRSTIGSTSGRTRSGSCEAVRVRRG